MNPADTEDIGQFRFEMAIDGEESNGKLIVETTRDPDALGAMSRRYLHNLPDGLSAGTYTFHAVWSVPDSSDFEAIDRTVEVELTD